MEDKDEGDREKEGNEDHKRRTNMMGQRRKINIVRGGQDNRTKEDDEDWAKENNEDLARGRLGVHDR